MNPVKFAREEVGLQELRWGQGNETANMKSKAIPITGLGGLWICEMLRILHIV
jgi:hypothetical protein